VLDLAEEAFDEIAEFVEVAAEGGRLDPLRHGADIGQYAACCHFGSLAAIGVLCWLLFTLAVFALPAFIGVSAGIWAHETGAGLVGAIVIGAAAAGMALGSASFCSPSCGHGWLVQHGVVALFGFGGRAIAGR
jgi:hypothetical protein